MKLSISAIIEELREAAQEDADLIDPAVMSMTDSLEWEAADLIEELVAVLEKVAAGDPASAQLARDALDPKKRVMSGLVRLAKSGQPSIDN